MRVGPGQRGEGTRRSSRRWAAALAVLALPLVTAACNADALTAAAIEELDVATAEVQAQRLGVGVRSGPLYVVDGVIVTDVEARGLSPDAIASIEVLKSPAALADWGAAGADGVIVISTRDGVAEGDPAAGTRVRVRQGGLGAAGGEEGRRLVIRAPDGTGTALAGDPLIVIDGVVADAGAMQRLTPSAIDRIEVIKGAAAAQLWGERGAQGVVRITTKSGAR